MFDNFPPEVLVQVEALYKNGWQPAVRALRREGCQKQDDIKDIYQNAFLVTALRWQEGRINGEPLAFLIGVCRNLWWRERNRRIQKEGDLETTGYNLTPSNEADNLKNVVCKEMREVFRKKMQQVWTPQQYVIMMLRLDKHLTNPEIAELLGITTAVVANAASESKRALTLFIEENPYWRGYLGTYLNDCF